MQLIHTSCFERHRPIKHGKEHDTSTPQIHVVAISIFVLKDLRCNISWSSALLPHFDSRLTLFTDTKVSNLDRALSIKKNVVKFDISVCYAFRMDVIESINNLFEYLYCKWFLQASSLPDIIEQVSTSAQLHYNYDMLLCFNRLIYLHNVIMSQLQKKIHLFHQLLLLNLICQALLVERF